MLLGAHLLWVVLAESPMDAALHGVATCTCLFGALSGRAGSSPTKSQHAWRENCATAPGQVRKSLSQYHPGLELKTVFPVVLAHRRTPAEGPGQASGAADADARRHSQAGTRPVPLSIYLRVATSSETAFMHFFSQACARKLRGVCPASHHSASTRV